MAADRHHGEPGGASSLHPSRRRRDRRTRGACRVERVWCIGCKRRRSAHRDWHGRHLHDGGVPGRTQTAGSPAAAADHAPRSREYPQSWRWRGLRSGRDRAPLRRRTRVRRGDLSGRRAPLERRGGAGCASLRAGRIVRPRVRLALEGARRSRRGTACRPGRRDRARGSCPTHARAARCDRAGIFGAAGLYALDHHVSRLADDHQNARHLASRLVASTRIQLDLATVQTNIVMFHLVGGAPDADTAVAAARERGVLVVAFGPRTVRAVTHFDVSREQCERGADILASIAESA